MRRQCFGLGALCCSVIYLSSLFMVQAYFTCISFDQLLWPINTLRSSFKISAFENLGSNSVLQNYIPRLIEFGCDWVRYPFHTGPIWISSFVLCFVAITCKTNVEMHPKLHTADDWSFCVKCQCPVASIHMPDGCSLRPVRNRGGSFVKGVEL